MAGYANGFADGGEVDDNSGALPVEDEAPAQQAAPAQQDDNSGALPVAQEDPQQAQQPAQEEQHGRSGMRPPHEALRDAGKSILSYLMGEGAAPPQAAQKFAQGVKAEHPGISDDDANVIAVHKAMELGGPEAAGQMVQFNRMAYNAKQSFAFAAMQGTPQKPPDPRSAADAATKASAHVLDGSRARFAAQPDGSFVAQVHMPGAGKPVTYKLSAQQMAQYLNVGKDGQYDAVMEHGVPGTLQKVSAGGSQPNGLRQEISDVENKYNDPDRVPSTRLGHTADGQDIRGTLQKVTAAVTTPAAGSKSPAADTYEDDDTDDSTSGAQPAMHRKSAAEGSNFGKTPSTLDLSGGDNEIPAHEGNLQDRANRLFPSASQGDQRNRYIATQMDQAAQGRRAIRKSEVEGVNKQEIAKLQGGSRVEAAGIREKGVEHSADQRAATAKDSNDLKRQQLAQRIQSEAQKTTDLNKRAQLRADYSLVNSPNFMTMDDNQKKAILSRAGLPVEEQRGWFGGGSTAKPAAAAPQQQAAPAQGAPQRPANVPQGAKFYKGQWYTRGAGGEAVAVPQ